MMQRLQLFILAASVAAALTMQVRTATGPRGSDQYWYLQDVESIALRGSATTNAVYPVNLEPPAKMPPPIIHNIVPVYLVALLVPALGAYKAWLAANLIGLGLIAACVFLSVLRLSGSRGAAVCAAVVMVTLPCSNWLASQPLADLLVGLPVALALLALAWRDSFAGWLVAAVFTGIACFSRQSFGAALLLLPVAFVVSKGIGRANLLRAAALAIVGVAFIFLNPVIFTQSFKSCLLRFSTETGASNMGCYYTPYRPPAITIGMLARVLTSSAADQIKGTSLASQVFYLPFNLLALGTLAAFLKTRRSSSGVVWFGLVMLATHVATIVVFQNQYRYIAPVQHVLVVCTAVWCVSQFRWSPKVWTIAALLVALAGLGTSWVLLKRGVAGAVEDRRGILAEKALFGSLPAGDAILMPRDILYQARLQSAAYPRLVLMADATRFTARFCAAVHDLNVKWVYALPGDMILSLVNPELIASTAPAANSEPQPVLWRLRDFSCRVNAP